jgi:hypothetical protein
MWKTFIATLFTLLLSLPVLSQGTINAEGSSTVTTVLWFNKTEITVKSSGDLSSTGSIDLNGETINFSAAGATFGSGLSNMETLATMAWNLVNASGTTENGVPISIRGGVTISSSETDLATCSLGSGTGVFFFVVELPDRLVYVRGDAAGAATGTFVRPEDPSTMQIEGTGAFVFQGEVLAEEIASTLGSEEALLVELPWDLSTWPEELLAQLVELILNRPSEEE